MSEKEKTFKPPQPSVPLAYMLQEIRKIQADLADLRVKLDQLLGDQQ